MDKLSNLLYLTRCGFYDYLEEGGLAGHNMGTWCRAHKLATATISKIAPVRTKTEKLLQYILASAAMLSFETVLLVLVVLVLIKDHFIIKRMLATWHPYTRASFIISVNSTAPGTCSPAGSRIPYEIYAHRIPKVSTAMHLYRH